MKRGDTINGYRIVDDQHIGGNCIWTFAEKGGKSFFIKKFLYPTYPDESAPGSPEKKNRRREICARFTHHHERLLKVLRGKCAEGGNLIVPIEIFRFGSHFYKITEKIDVTYMPSTEIASLPFTQCVIILRTVAISLRILHGEKIVHGDLKPENILIKRTETGDYASKLIDFDNSYFSQNPIDPTGGEDVVGDPRFYSPELSRFISHDPHLSRDQLQTASDIFTLGLVYYEYLTGRPPNFQPYRYAADAALAGKKLEMGPEIVDLPLRDLLERMLLRDLHQRPNINEVFAVLKGIRLTSDISLPLYDKESSRSPGVRINFGSKIVAKDSGHLPTISSDLDASPKPRISLGNKK